MLPGDELDDLEACWADVRVPWLPPPPVSPVKKYEPTVNPPQHFDCRCLVDGSRYDIRINEEALHSIIENRLSALGLPRYWAQWVEDIGVEVDLHGERTVSLVGHGARVEVRVDGHGWEINRAMITRSRGDFYRGGYDIPGFPYEALVPTVGTEIIPYSSHVLDRG